MCCRFFSLFSTVFSSRRSHTCPLSVCQFVCFFYVSFRYCRPSHHFTIAKFRFDKRELESIAISFLYAVFRATNIYTTCAPLFAIWSFLLFLFQLLRMLLEIKVRCAWFFSFFCFTVFRTPNEEKSIRKRWNTGTTSKRPTNKVHQTI